MLLCDNHHPVSRLYPLELSSENRRFALCIISIGRGRFHPKGRRIIGGAVPDNSAANAIVPPRIQLRVSVLSLLLGSSDADSAERIDGENEIVGWDGFRPSPQGAASQVRTIEFRYEPARVPAGKRVGTAFGQSHEVDPLAQFRLLVPASQTEPADVFCAHRCAVPHGLTLPGIDYGEGKALRSADRHAETHGAAAMIQQVAAVVPGMKSSFLAPLGLLLLLILAGCGGSGGGSVASLPSSGGQGRATLTVQWPVRPTRLIPSASNSISVIVKQGTTVFAQQTLARPAAGGTSTASFTTLPTGILSVTAAAYPSCGPPIKKIIRIRSQDLNLPYLQNRIPCGSLPLSEVLLRAVYAVDCPPQGAFRLFLPIGFDAPVRLIECLGNISRGSRILWAAERAGRSRSGEAAVSGAMQHDD